MIASFSLNQRVLWDDNFWLNKMIKKLTDWDWFWPTTTLDWNKLWFLRGKRHIRYPQAPSHETRRKEHADHLCFVSQDITHVTCPNNHPTKIKVHETLISLQTTVKNGELVKIFLSLWHFNVMMRVLLQRIN